MNEIIRKLLAEFVGTCFLVMIVIGSGIMAQNLSSDQLSVLLANTIATGTGLTVLIWIFISISGAHFNPAVSLIMFLKKELTMKQFFYFTSFQFAGGFLGAILANIIFGLDPLQISENEKPGAPRRCPKRNRCRPSMPCARPANSKTPVAHVQLAQSLFP